MLEKKVSCLLMTLQCGVMPDKGTTDVIFIMRQVQERQQARKNKLYYDFVDLKKAFDLSLE